MTQLCSAIHPVITKMNQDNMETNPPVVARVCNPTLIWVPCRWQASSLHVWANYLWDSTLQKRQCLQQIAWKYQPSERHVNLNSLLNLPQFVLVADYYLWEPRFVYRSCFRYQCCRHSWVLIGGEGAGKIIKTKYWSQRLPAREKKSDNKDGQDCHGPKKSSKRGSARKMGPAVQGGAFAEMREHVHRSYCGVPGRLHHGWLGVFLVLPSPGY